MVSMIEISTNTELFRYASLQTLVDDKLNGFVDMVMLAFAPGPHEAPSSLHMPEEQGSGAETGRRGTAGARATSASSGQGILRCHTQATKAALG
jgi:hypothetical protein